MPIRLGSSERTSVARGVPVPELFKDYLHRHVRASGLRTQMALAKAIDMDYGQLNKIFRGKTQRPEIETL
jgi:hypothetical protein